MQNTSDVNGTAYCGIADYYELWSQGDYCWNSSYDFYVNILDGMSSPMLEAGIGTGRIAGAVLGHCDAANITGIDSSPEMLRICAEKYKDFVDADRLRLINADFCDDSFNFPGRFKTVYMPFRTIGHILTDAQMNKFFERIFTSLADDGIFMFDHYIFDRSWAEQHNHTKRIMYSDEQLTISDYYVYDFENHLMDCRISVNDVVVQKFKFRWFIPDEIRNFAENSGFRVSKLFGDFDGSSFDSSSENQIWLLQKNQRYVNTLHRKDSR